MRCVARHFFHLAHDDGRGDGAQGGEAEARDCALEFGDGAAARVVAHRVGQPDDARGEDGLGGDQLAERVDGAIRIVEHALDAQGDVRVRRKNEVAAFGIGGDGGEY